MRFGLCAGLVVITLLAQEPTISVNTRLVEVDVVVRNDNGPVKDLTQDDFSVFDRGKRQKIAAFSVKGRDSAPPHFDLPPGAVTNRAAGSGATIILFDMLNTAVEDNGTTPQLDARLQLIKYLRTIEPRNSESYALFSLLKDLRVAQDFTTDREKILDAGMKIIPEHSADQGAENLGADLLASAPDLHDAIANEMYKNSIKEMQDFARKNRASITAAALKIIAAHLKEMPGRKKLVWISASFPAATTDMRSRNGQQLIEHQEFSGEIESAVRALNDANIGVYPIDPRSLTAGLDADGIDTMNLFATGTGGKSSYVHTDQADAIREAVEDTEMTYTLGFYPSDLISDGSFHDLSVEVARKGVEIRARKGYFAPGAKALSEKQMEKSIEQTLSSPVAAMGLGLAVRVDPEKSPHNSYRIEVTFDPRELRLEHQNNTWVGLLRLVTYAPNSRRPNAHRDEIKFTLTDQRMREVMTAGRYTFRRSVQIALSKPSDVRVALEDRVTGATGSVQVHVDPN